MKILSITAQKPDSTGSGVYLTELVRGFEKMGIGQAVITGISVKDSVNFAESVQVFPVYFETEKLPFPVVGMSDEMPYRSTRYSDMTEDMTERFADVFRRTLAKAVEEFQPDVILCHHLYFLAALVRENVKSGVYAISHGSDLRQFKKNPWQRAFIAKWIPKLDGIFALHKEQKTEICEVFGCEDEKVRVIGTGYNSDVFYIEEKTESEKWETGESLRLIFAGKISEKKGVKSLIRALEYLRDMTGKDICLTLAGGAGDEGEYQEIRTLAKESPCQIEFAGRLTQKELAKRLNQSDIFVLPSFYEGLPLVVVEAMACGLRVVCTDLPGIKPWLNENIPEHGVVFVEPPVMVNEDEPVEELLPAFERRLAEAICKAQKTRLSKCEEVERISWDSLCGKLKEILDAD